LSEKLIAKAFPNQRDEIVIATKLRYDFVHYGEARGRGQREIPQDFFASNLSATAGLNDLLTSACASAEASSHEPHQINWCEFVNFVSRKRLRKKLKSNEHFDRSFSFMAMKGKL
jgi:hypothetical protein